MMVYCTVCLFLLISHISQSDISQTKYRYIFQVTVFQFKIIIMLKQIVVPLSPSYNPVVCPIIPAVLSNFPLIILKLSLKIRKYNHYVQVRYIKSGKLSKQSFLD